jgi:hypothetical protein
LHFQQAAWRVRIFQGQNYMAVQKSAHYKEKAEEFHGKDV